MAIPALDIHWLRADMRDPGRYLPTEFGYYVEQDVVVQIMAELGIPPIEWYRLVFHRGCRDSYRHHFVDTSKSKVNPEIPPKQQKEIRRVLSMGRFDRLELRT
jgi:hypothetical protein